MDESSVYYKNPWDDDDRSVGSLKHVLILAERTGNLEKQKVRRHIWNTE